MSNIKEISILKLLYKNKIKLLLATLLIGVIVAIFSQLSPDLYSSTAAISIQRPEVALTGEMPPLRIEALQAMAESTQVKWELFQKLKDLSILDEKHTFNWLQSSLSTSVESNQGIGRDRELLPMIKLMATTTSPELSMTISNYWIDVVLNRINSIYQTGVDKLENFITNIYQKASNSLIENENQYTDYVLESKISTNKLLLKHNKELYSILSDEIIKLENNAAIQNALLIKTQEKINEQEIGGIWVGKIFSRNYLENEKYVASTPTPMIKRLAWVISNWMKNERELSRLDRTSQIEYKHIILKIKRKQIGDISSEIMKAQTRLFSMEPTYSKLKLELMEIEPKLILSKAIADDILWSSYLNDDVRDKTKLPLLKSESSNPTYQSTIQMMISLSSEINGAKSTLSQGKKELDLLRETVNDLSQEIGYVEARRKLLLRVIKQDQDLLNYYELSYNNDRQRYETKEKELTAMNVELVTKNKTLVKVEEKITKLEDVIFPWEDKIARKKRNVNNMTQVCASLASRAEEVALLKVTMENVSRSRTILLYKAQANPAKVGPQRGRSVLIAMIMTFLVGSVLIGIKKIIQE